MGLFLLISSFTKSVLMKSKFWCKFDFMSWMSQSLVKGRNKKKKACIAVN